jgi:rhamnogalacturonyl hydrolase YesR
MADWELGIQKDGGGWEGNVEGAKQPPLVFNTGQVVGGLLRMHQETGEGRYLEAAVDASGWIAKNQEEDGSWTFANFVQMKRVYDTYVTPPLARMEALTGDETYTHAAIRNYEFALRQQRENGWFDFCDNTHTSTTRQRLTRSVTRSTGYSIRASSSAATTSSRGPRRPPTRS